MPFFNTQRNNAPQQTPQQHYQSLRRGNITSAGKTATFDKLLALATSNNTTEKKIVTDVVRNLLDFKAAERAKDRNTINNSLRGVRDAIPQPNNQGLTYDECLELAKNRSGIFQRKLPDTLKRLVDDLLRLSLPSPGLITDTNRAFLIDCGWGAKVNLATPSQQLKQKFEEHFKKTKECFTEILTRNNSSPLRLEYGEIFDNAAVECSRRGGASGGTGDQEPFLCGQPMHLPPHNHNQPILQVAAEWTRLHLSRSSKDTNSLVTSNQAVAQARLNRLSGVVEMNCNNAVEQKPEFTFKQTTLNDATIQYLRSKGLWRQDNELSTGRPSLTTAHAAVAACALSYQRVAGTFPRIFGSLSLTALEMSHRVLPNSRFMLHISDNEHKISQDFLQFCIVKGIKIQVSSWQFHSYNHTSKHFLTSVYMRIDSGTESGTAFRLFYKESMPYHVSFDDANFLVIQPIYRLATVENVVHPPPTSGLSLKFDPQP